MNCTRCNKELTPVFLRRRYDDYPQYEDALVIDFSGGYGMYYDPMVTEIKRQVLCKSLYNYKIQSVFI